MFVAVIMHIGTGRHSSAINKINSTVEICQWSELTSVIILSNHDIIIHLQYSVIMQYSVITVANLVASENVIKFCTGIIDGYMKITQGS